MAQRTGSLKETVRTRPGSSLTPEQARIAASPQAFDGSGDWQEWISAFEICSELNGWTDKTKLRWLQLRLVGAAGRTFRRLPPEATISFFAAKETLFKAFLAPGQQLVNETAFRLKRRSAAESWSSHAEALVLLAEKAYPQLGSDAVDAIVNAQLLL
uniref:Retrotransposon gag domain-containing protein n=1 Tax=Trichuris muris TaxID=70415 RepID=A0A5S6QB37_TRIMR